MSADAAPVRLALRRAELAVVARHFTPRCKVLEIGGGNGWQASILASWGCHVSSIDITPNATYHPVDRYDGRTIPFGPETFDVVFSSNVLEHVEDLAALFPEMTRVLKPGGTMIHVVPSASWRLWTLLAHYPNLVTRINTRFRTDGRPDGGSAPSGNGPDRPFVLRLKNLVWSGVHGAHGTALAELASFSRWRWRARFTRAHLQVVDEYRTGLYYSGYKLFPALTLETRRALSRWMGSSCHVFVVRPAINSGR